MYRFYRFMFGLVGFSRSQTNGFLLFLPLVLLVIFSEPVFRLYQSGKREDFTSDIRRLDSLVALLEKHKPSVTRGDSARPAHVVAFNPNTAPAEIMLKAGLEKGLVQRIINFRKKGGDFRIKRDLLKIYGMDSSQYLALEKFILLPEQLNNKILSNSGEIRKARGAPIMEMKDVNTADTASLRKIRGIGEKLSLRILKYRDALGGFVSLRQLAEVYRLDTTVVRSIGENFFISKDFVPAQLNINSAGRQELSTHPYISSTAANAIVAYRFQHGEFKTIEDLRKIPAIDSIMFRKLVPYLKLNNL
jgi:competence protein ComEA